MHLDRLSKNDGSLGGAYLLLAESAANVLAAYANVRASVSGPSVQTLAGLSRRALDNMHT